jgi:Domain of unknown function (DUF4336)
MRVMVLPSTNSNRNRPKGDDRCDRSRHREYWWRRSECWRAFPATASELTMAIRETSLEPFGDRQVWVQHVPLKFFGLQMGTRMTVVRLDDGSLFVHSPTAADDKARRGVDELGPVRFIIAPNRLHHLWVAEWAAAYPHAQLWGSPKLLQKRKDIAWTGALGDAPEAGWAAEVDQIKRSLVATTGSRRSCSTTGQAGRSSSPTCWSRPTRTTSCSSACSGTSPATTSARR